MSVSWGKNFFQFCEVRRLSSVHLWVRFWAWSQSSSHPSIFSSTMADCFEVLDRLKWIINLTDFLSSFSLVNFWPMSVISHSANAKMRPNEQMCPDKNRLWPHIHAMLCWQCTFHNFLGWWYISNELFYSCSFVHSRFVGARSFHTLRNRIGGCSTTMT